MTATEEMVKKAENGDAVQQHILGLTYLYEHRNYPMAEYWLRQAAEQDYDIAFWPLAKLYDGHDHNGVKTDYVKCLHWCHKANESEKDDNQHYACSLMGWIYYEGKGTEVDYKKSAEMFSRSSDLRYEIILRRG